MRPVSQPGTDFNNPLRFSAPVNWQKGEPVIVHPSVSNEEAQSTSPAQLLPRVRQTRLTLLFSLLFPSPALFPNFKTVKPYLRFTSEEQGKTIQ